MLWLKARSMVYNIQNVTGVTSLSAFRKRLKKLLEIECKAVSIQEIV